MGRGPGGRCGSEDRNGCTIDRRAGPASFLLRAPDVPILPTFLSSSCSRRQAHPVYVCCPRKSVSLHLPSFLPSVCRSAITVDLIPSLLGISISSPLSSRRRRRRRRRHDGTNPISFRIKHRFIIITRRRRRRRRSSRRSVREHRQEERAETSSGMPAGKMSTRPTKCLFIHPEGRKEGKKGGRQILLKSPLWRNCPHYIFH